MEARLDSPNWIDELSWVLLGIRTTPKEDLGTSSAELVYGTPITVPGEFVATSDDPSVVEELSRLRQFVKNLVPEPTVFHRQNKSSFPKNLKTAKFIFVRRDMHRKPLQKPYDGPFRVIQPGDKFFKLQVGDREENVSVDRLKPRFLDDSEPIALAVPKRRGRRRRSPTRRSSQSRSPKKEDDHLSFTRQSA